MKRIYLIIVFLLFTSNLWAETLYVRPHVTDAGCTYGACDGSNYANAWEGFAGGDGTPISWGAGAGNLGAGDTLYIAGGAHDEELDIGGDGTSGNYITIRGDAPEGTGWIDMETDSAVNYYGIHLAGHDYIYFLNLTIDGDEDDSNYKANIFAQSDATYNVVDNCILRDSYQSGTWFMGANTHSNTFKNSFAYNNGKVVDHGGGFVFSEGTHDNIVEDCEAYGNSEDGVGLGGNGAEGACTGDDNIVRRNYLHDNDEDGVDSKGNSGNIIEDNHIINNTRIGIFVHGWTDSMIIRYNHIGNNGLYGIQLHGESDTSGGHQVYGNVIENNGSYGIYALAFTGQSYIYNTTFYNNNGQYGKEIRIANGDFTLKNNIITGDQGSDAYLIRVSDTTNMVLDYNLYYNFNAGDDNVIRYGNGTVYKESDIADGDFNTATGQEANAPNAGDPLFVDKANDNYTLQSTSPCIDAGVDLGASYDDALMYNSSWPTGVVTGDQDAYGIGWEIGAYISGGRTIEGVSFSGVNVQ